jgi:hypothetical protein
MRRCLLQPGLLLTAVMHISGDVAPVRADQTLRSNMPDEWYIENLRLTFFEVTDWTPRPIFSEVAGVLPSQINAQPPMQVHQEMGNLGDAYLSVAQQGNRIDVVLSDQPTRNTVNPTLPGYKPLYSVGPFPQSLEPFNAIATKTISLLSGATRAAFSMTLVHQTDAAREATKFLCKYLPTVDFDPNNDVEIAFQINRPRRNSKGRTINRLARWDTIQVLSLRMAVGGAVGVLPVPSALPVFAARTYVDISTDALNTSPIDRSELSEIVDELREHAMAIAKDGDSNE